MGHAMKVARCRQPTLAVVFIAQATSTALSPGDLLLVLGVALLTSKDAHGVPGSAIVILIARFAISLLACLPGSFSLNSTRD